MANQNIIGITIGPIYQLMKRMRKTRHLWGASYLFSYIMKQIITAIKQNQSLKGKIILPYSDENKQLLKLGVGLFSDRLYLSTNNSDDDLLKVINIKNEVSRNVINSLANTGDDSRRKYLEFLNAFIQIYVVKLEVPETENIILKTSPYLDTAELMKKVFNDDLAEEIDLEKFIDDLNGELFYKDAFTTPRESVDELDKIATKDLKNINPVEYDKLYKNKEIENLIEKLKQSIVFKDHLRIHHRYVAVIQADGDGIGKIIEKIGTIPEALNQFSKALFRFARQASEIISNYGKPLEYTGKINEEFRALPVYIGGDDLLFFAPVAYDDGKYLRTVFDLISDIDLAFFEIMKPLTEKYSTAIPTLSYGMSINYYKFPLNEMKEEAYRLLQKAKTKHTNKNTIEFLFRKHSGQKFGFGLEKDKQKSYNSFKSILTQINDGGDSFFNGITYKLEALQTLFNMLGNNKHRLDALFDNYFNEDIHGQHSKKEFIEMVNTHIHNTYNEYHQNSVHTAVIVETDERNDNLSKIYAALRFTHLLNSKENED